MPRIQDEKKTIKIMVSLYCRNFHQTKNSLCNSCDELYEYALKRLDQCPFKEEKPVCKKCTVHCYKPDKREQVRKIIRYAGPRMIFHHPVIAIKHLIK